MLSFKTLIGLKFLPCHEEYLQAQTHDHRKKDVFCKDSNKNHLAQDELDFRTKLCFAKNVSVVDHGDEHESKAENGVTYFLDEEDQALEMAMLHVDYRVQRKV